MKIGGAYQLPLGRDRAYSLLQDPAILAGCIPGCDGLVRTADHEYDMKMKLALASISGLFEGKVRITEQKEPRSFRLGVEGKGKIGFMKGEGLLQLADKDGGTEVSYEGDVHVGGTIAAVGQRLLDTTAKMMIKRFFDKLAEIAGQ